MNHRKAFGPIPGRRSSHCDPGPCPRRCPPDSGMVKPTTDPGARAAVGTHPRAARLPSSEFGDPRTRQRSGAAAQPVPRVQHQRSSGLPPRRLGGGVGRYGARHLHIPHGAAGQRSVPAGAAEGLRLARTHLGLQSRRVCQPEWRVTGGFRERSEPTDRVHHDRANDRGW